MNKRVLQIFSFIMALALALTGCAAPLPRRPAARLPPLPRKLLPVTFLATKPCT